MAELNGHIPNWDRWQSYTDGLSSPQSYIDWSWLYLVGAALQRRCWLGPPHQPLFANKYVILIGEPGIGKGLPIREVSTFLKHWKKCQGVQIDPLTLTPTQKQQADLLRETELDDAKKKEFQGNVKNAELFEPLLYPVAADATTYEALVKAVADSYARCNFVGWNEKQQKDTLQVCGHSSLCFCLQELASLMRKRTDDTVNYMLGLYDCPVDYEYDTKTKGKDRVRRACLNMIAGTTPGFMQSTFDERLADEGWNSRTFYVYAQKNRKNQFFIPALTKEQEDHKKHLLEHVRQLSGLYGNVKIDKETEDFLQTMWNERENNKHLRTNSSVKLKSYYSRWNIHVMKIAMAGHFGESLEMFIPLSRFKWAIEFLNKEEVNMHMAITLEGNNPISKISKKVLELLSVGRQNWVDMCVETHHLGGKNDLTEAIDFLTESSQIVSESELDEDTDTKTTYWRLK